MMKKIANIQYITPTERKAYILERSEAFLKAGGCWVQLRMKDASMEEFLEVAKEMRELCNHYNATFIINDNIAVAKQSGADGVHLGKMDISTSEARQFLGSDPIIGRTANSVKDIISLKDQEIDYIGLGPFRYTQTKKRLAPLLGADGCKEAIKAARQEGINIPIVVVGGIVEDDMASVKEIGADGVAVSGVIATATDISSTMEKMITELTK